MFINYYECNHCRHAWSDVWPQQCDDDCPNCGARHSSPMSSCDVEEEEDESETPSTFINHYECPRCQHVWSDTWSCQCDDDCPNCGARHISPTKSCDIDEDIEDPETAGASLPNSVS